MGELTEKRATTYRVLVTGSRAWTDYLKVEKILTSLTETLGTDITLVHGKCRGLDLMAEGIAKALGWEIDPYPAKWSVYGKAAGPIRNQEMVDSGADMCIGFPFPNSDGTFDCMLKAASAGIPVFDFGEYNENDIHA